MRRRTKLQILVAVAAIVAVSGLAISPTVAEARRNPRPAATQRYVPPPPPTPVATATPTPVATVAPAPAVTVPVARFTENFESLAAGMSWPEGSVQGPWVDVFNGYGTTGVESDGNLVLAQSPKASTQPGETHAALAVTTPHFSDVDLTLQMRTVSQLRSGSTANAWEVAWVLWNYTDNTHFYYLVLKPGGFEIGKEDPAYPGAQRFLVTSGSVQFPIGRWYTVHVRQTGSTFTVSVDGTQIAQFTDNERPYTSGAVGLYSEDAYVHFNNVVVQ